MTTEREQRWHEIRDLAKARWSRLRDADIDDVRGNVDRLVDALRARYGYAHWFAEREILDWRRSIAAEARIPEAVPAQRL
jgi:hypothetical protein